MFKLMNTVRGSVCMFALAAAAARMPGVSRAQATAIAAPAGALLSQWKLASFCTVKGSGPTISVAGYRPDGWMPVTVPSTVLAAQLAAGKFNGLAPGDAAAKAFDPFFGTNLRAIPGTSYSVGTFFSNQEVPADSPYA